MDLTSLPTLLFLIFLITLDMSETRAQSPQPKVLIYSYVAPGEYVHASIPTAIQAMTTNGSTTPIMFENTDDPTQFTDSNLAQYDALIFLMNVGEVLDASGKQSLQNYLNKGGNFVAIHSASDCLRNTTFYGKEVGAFFDYHPALQNGTVVVLVNDNPSTTMLPQRWQLQDEFYNFKSDPRAVGAQVLLTVDESTYTDTGTKMNQGTPHPICWLQDRGSGAISANVAGRSWYTSLGHLSETWETDLYVQHVMGGITWALLSNTTKAFNATGLVGNGGSAANSSSSSSLTGGTTTSAPGTAAPGGGSTSATNPGAPSASPSAQSGLASSLRTTLVGVLLVVLVSALALQ